ncbi:MAG: flavodoxin-dependent (E)-4-hydroxy-3-methylbut-2-enyl-diphosphate synthase, partial [Planctomycetia bacterium]
VNGIGEAKEADLGIAAGRGKGVIFKRGEIIKHVDESEMVDALLAEVDLWEREEAAGLSPRKSKHERRAAAAGLLPIVQ